MRHCVHFMRQSQFKPKMKANAVPRLLSSLVWIDQYYQCNGMTNLMDHAMREGQGHVIWRWGCERGPDRGHRGRVVAGGLTSDQWEWVIGDATLPPSLPIDFSCFRVTVSSPLDGHNHFHPSAASVPFPSAVVCATICATNLPMKPQENPQWWHEKTDR